jgi:hypothetical protein
VAIKDEVLTRRMPPWNAVKGFGRFKNDLGLTQEELSLIADWVEGGAPEGDPMLMPVRPAAVASSKFPRPGRSLSRGPRSSTRRCRRSGFEWAASRPDTAANRTGWVRELAGAVARPTPTGKPGHRTAPY